MVYKECTISDGTIDRARMAILSGGTYILFDGSHQLVELENGVGGTYKMSFTNFTSGQGHSFGGEYLELVPFKRICYSDRFDDPNLPGEMKTTVTFKPVSCGTEIDIMQEGIPEAISLEMCYLGWQESLTQLAHLVEPEIPG